MFKMIIGSDIVPTEGNIGLFKEGNAREIVGDKLLKVLKEADFTVFNLETPLCDVENPILKCGPNLIAPSETVKGIKEIGTSLLALANNHILDQDVDGLYKTFEMLNEHKIPYIGAGKNLDEARKPYVIDADGKKIGIYNCAEHEFTIAEEDKAGANPFDALESPDHIAALKEVCDFVVVLYHGGKEYYPYPSPNLQKICRKIVEKGADLVVCQHSHCVGCEEKYLGGTIVYGQGNFIFAKNFDIECWQISILVEAEFSDDLKINYIPITIHEKGTRLAESEKAREIMDGFYSRSEEIKDKKFLIESFKKVAVSSEEMYLFSLAGRESNLKITQDKFIPCYDETALLRMTNYLLCEPHKECVDSIVKQRLEKILEGR